MDQEVDIYRGEEGFLVEERPETETTSGMSLLLGGVAVKTGRLETGLMLETEDPRLQAVTDQDHRCQETSEIREIQGSLHQEMSPGESSGTALLVLPRNPSLTVAEEVSEVEAGPTGEADIRRIGISPGPEAVPAIENGTSKCAMTEIMIATLTAGGMRS